MSGDYKHGNKCYKNIMNAIRYIAERDNYEYLKPMLEDANPSLRIWAAFALLHVDTKNAVKTLKTVIKEDHGIIGFNAEITLEEFKKGNI